MQKFTYKTEDTERQCKPDTLNSLREHTVFCFYQQVHDVPTLSILLCLELLALLPCNFCFTFFPQLYDAVMIHVSIHALFSLCLT